VMLLFYWRMLKTGLQIKEIHSRKIIYSLLLFMFFNDNMATGFNFLSNSSGTLAFSLVLIFLVNDLLLKSGSLPSDV